MKNTFLAISGTILLSMAAAPAQSAILSVSEGGRTIDPPRSVVSGSRGFANSEYMLGFDERQNVLLSDNLYVDSGWIVAGTRVNSHTIFMNTPENQFLSLNRVKWTFENPILGVMSDRSGRLQVASSDLLGIPDTEYPMAPSAGRGMDNNNYFGITPSVLSVSMAGTESGDYIRVITEAESVPRSAETESVPEPSVLMGLLAIAGLGVASAADRECNRDT